MTGSGVFNVNVGVFRLSHGNLNRLLFNDDNTFAGLIIVASGCIRVFAPALFGVETGGNWKTCGAAAVGVVNGDRKGDVAIAASTGEFGANIGVVDARAYN